MPKKTKHIDLRTKEKIIRDLIILASIEILCYLKCPFPGDEQEHDVVLGMLSEGFSEFPTIGAVLELSVAGKDLQVKLAARQAYLKQSEYMF